MKAAIRKLSVISHQELGDIRSVIIKGEPWFVAKDLCDLLGYVNNRDAIIKNIYPEDRADVAISDGSQNRSMTIVNESGLYSLIMKSRLETAKTFQRWVTSEVLPAIRRQGFYVNPAAQLSRVEFRRLERAMRENTNKYIYPEDIWKCHLKLRVPESHIKRVMGGHVIDNVVMTDLQERALSNQERFLNAYSPQRMQDVIKALSIKKQ